MNEGCNKMQIGTNYNVPSTQTKVTLKSKETGPLEHVEIGGEPTDDTFMIGKELKKANFFKSGLESVDSALVKYLGYSGSGALYGIASLEIIAAIITVGSPIFPLAMTLFGLCGAGVGTAIGICREQVKNPSFFD